MIIRYDEIIEIRYYSWLEKSMNWTTANLMTIFRSPANWCSQMIVRVKMRFYVSNQFSFESAQFFIRP